MSTMPPDVWRDVNPTDQPYAIVPVRVYARIYSLSRQTVYNMLRSGRIEGRMVNGVQHIVLHMFHVPPLSAGGNPNFANAKYQRELARRPRPGRHKKRHR